MRLKAHFGGIFCRELPKNRTENSFACKKLASGETFIFVFAPPSASFLSLPTLTWKETNVKRLFHVPKCDVNIMARSINFFQLSFVLEGFMNLKFNKSRKENLS